MIPAVGECSEEKKKLGEKWKWRMSRHNHFIVHDLSFRLLPIVRWHGEIYTDAKEIKDNLWNYIAMLRIKNESSTVKYLFIAVVWCSRGFHLKFFHSHSMPMTLMLACKYGSSFTAVVFGWKNIQNDLCEQSIISHSLKNCQNVNSVA